MTLLVVLILAVVALAHAETEATQAICRRLVKVGGTCTSDQVCVAGAYCMSGKCTAAPGFGFACANGVYCAAGLACDTNTAVCAGLPGRGKTCATKVDGPYYCANSTTLGCSQTTQTCELLPKEGALCTWIDNRCAPGFGCDFTPNDGSLCTARRAVGKACTTNWMCAAGAYCAVDVCAPLKTSGKGCQTTVECAAGLSCMPRFWLAPLLGFTCQTMPTTGKKCMFECASTADYCA